MKSFVNVSISEYHCNNYFNKKVTSKDLQLVIFCILTTDNFGEKIKAPVLDFQHV
jgi:hypothetical protein